MSQRDVIFYHGNTDDPRDWTMNGLVPPLVMELKTDTLEWCTTSFKNSYPNRVRTNAMTNDRYLLKSYWCGPYVKMSLWCDSPGAKSDVYEPLTRRMESAATVLNNVYRYFETYDILYALDFNTNLSLDLTTVDMSRHAAATFKIETPRNFNEEAGGDGADSVDDAHTEIVIAAADQAANDQEFYNPVYDKLGVGTGTKNAASEGTVVTINSRLLSDVVCSGNGETLKDPLSRVPADMRTHLIETVLKKRREYQLMSGGGPHSEEKLQRPVKIEPQRTTNADGESMDVPLGGDESSSNAMDKSYNREETKEEEEEEEDVDPSPLYRYTEDHRRSSGYRDAVPDDLMPGPTF